MDWQRFQFDYRLRLDSQRTELIQIEAYKEAALNLVLPPDWREQLDQLNRVRAVHGTTALEGNPLSEAAVSQQIASAAASSGQPPSRSREEQQVRNASVAQEWVRERFTPESRPLGYSDIIHMHATLTRGSDEIDNVPGQLRNHSVVVGTETLGGVHRGAPPDGLFQLVMGFVDFMNSQRVAAEHPVVRALLAHFFLITLHPFGDGNGRVSRLVEAGILFQGGYNVLGFYGLSNYFYRNGDEYKRLLQQCRRLQPFDLTAFVAFGLKGFAAELKGINNFVKTKINRVIFRTALVRAMGQRVGKRRRVLNQREHDLLSFLLEETEPLDPFADESSKKIKLDDLLQAPYITTVYKNVTRRTFHRELLRLVEMGFIKPVGSKDDITIELDFTAIGKY